MLSEKKFNDTLLTLHEVQEIFRCGKRQAYELVRVHGFPAIKMGGKYTVVRTTKGKEMRIHILSRFSRMTRRLK